jgi:hypothetical protein
MRLTTLLHLMLRLRIYEYLPPCPNTHSWPGVYGEENYPFIHYLIKSIWSPLCSSKLKPRCPCEWTSQFKRREKAVSFSLLSSTSSMGRSGELSVFEHGLVIGCHIGKKSVRGIATLLKLPKFMAGDVIVKWKGKETTTMEPRPSRPRLTTDRTVKQWRMWFVKFTRHQVKQSPVCSTLLRIVQPTPWLCVES